MPIRMIPIKAKWITIIIATGVIFVFVTTKYQDGKNKAQSRSDCYTELNKEISGVITNAYFDTNINRKAFVLEFTSGKNYVFPIYLKDLNGYVEKGDSLHKKAGAFEFVIFRKGYDHPIIVADTVDCEKLGF